MICTALFWIDSVARVEHEWWNNARLGRRTREVGGLLSCRGSSTNSVFNQWFVLSKTVPEVAVRYWSYSYAALEHVLMVREYFAKFQVA